MAKVQAPLMSVSASGTVAKQLTFRATKRGAVVSLPGIPRKPPSQPQTQERARFAAALTAWRALDEIDRQKWVALAASQASKPHMIYAKEYLIQQITAPNQPLITALF